MLLDLASSMEIRSGPRSGPRKCLAILRVLVELEKQCPFVREVTGRQGHCAHALRAVLCGAHRPVPVRFADTPGAAGARAGQARVRGSGAVPLQGNRDPGLTSKGCALTWSLCLCRFTCVPAHARLARASAAAGTGDGHGAILSVALPRELAAGVGQRMLGPVHGSQVPPDAIRASHRV